ncbi:MAG: anthranilate synthase component I family protein [Thermoanaerobaculia bacterium]
MSHPVQLRAIPPIGRRAALDLVAAPGAALLEGWSDEPGWRVILPWPERTVDRTWSNAAGWRSVVDQVTSAPTWFADPLPGAPFLGGWVGYLAYDVGALHETAELHEELTPEPPVWFARHSAGIVVRPDGQHHLFAPEPDLARYVRELDAALAAIDDTLRPRVAFGSATLDDSLAGSAYARAVDSIRESIACGDVYQVNLTRRFRASVAVEPRDLYLAMTGEDPPRCSALLQGDGWTIVSASPEVFLRFDRRAGIAESRPIKGTIAREGQDVAEIAALQASLKDDSEHLMIVDLVRNDLGRVAPPGRVSVTEYKTVRTLRHVHHLESTVRADGLEGRTPADLLDALFPAGSITGAPKRAAVHTIRRLEPVPRGVYTGAIGFHDDRGRMELSVAIRTAIATEAEVRYHAGGGIVWDSDPDAEDAECRAKSVAFLDFIRRKRE